MLIQYIYNEFKFQDFAKDQKFCHKNISAFCCVTVERSLSCKQHWLLNSLKLNRSYIYITAFKEICVLFFIFEVSICALNYQ